MDWALVVLVVVVVAKGAVLWALRDVIVNLRAEITRLELDRDIAVGRYERLRKGIERKAAERGAERT